MDFIVSLRFPTMGKTSGAIMRMVQTGIPVITNVTVWYPELPMFIDKTPVQDCEDRLCDMSLRFVKDCGCLSEKAGVRLLRK